MEDFYAALERFLDGQGIDDLESPQAQAKMNEFIAKWNHENVKPGGLNANNAKTANDYIELAQQATSNRERIKLLRKALKLDPDSIDALVMYTICRSQNTQELLKEMQKIIKKAEDQVKEDLEEDSHEFYGYFGHRPYMRARQQYIYVLSEVGRKKDAIKEAEALLDLDHEDHLGIRDDLMAFYAYFEDCEKAEALAERYIDDESGMMLMPLALVYYRTGDYTKANEVLKKLNSHNQDLKRFLTNAVDDRIDQMSQDYYAPGRMSELVELYNNYAFAYEHTQFFDYALRIVKTFPNTKKRASRK